MVGVATLTARLGIVTGVILVATWVRADPLFSPAAQILEPQRQQLLDIAAVGDRLVAVGAAGLIIVSDDGGQTWAQAKVPVSATLTALAFPDAQNGWAVGHGGVILHSSDGGLAWELQFDGHQANNALLEYANTERSRLEAVLAGLEQADEVDEVALGDVEYALEDAIFLQEDAQLAVDTGPVDPFLDVQFYDAQRGWAAGAYGMLFYTVDGGASWQSALPRIDNPDRFHFYSIHLAEPDSVYLAGEAGLLYRSQAGEDFTRFDGVYEGSLFGVLPLADAVVTYGLRGNIFVMDEAASGWRALSSDNQTSLYGGTRLADGGAVLLGAGGVLVRLEADGAERVLRHPSRSTFSSAAQTSDGSIWLVGMSGLSRLDDASGAEEGGAP